MLSIENLSKGYGAQVLFEDASFKVNAKERVGLVGRNGHGKTTLLRIITGEESSDGGIVNTPRNYKLGYLSQQLDFKGKTIIEEASLGLKDDEKDDHWKAEKILFGLGFSAEDMSKSPYEFSGGFQVRLNLAKVLVSEPDLLVLDEPTNYLDISSIRWLENFLLRWKGELLLVTHDRSFMDKVVTHTVGIHRKKVKKIEGDTSKLYEQIAKEEEIYEKTRINEDQKRKDMELFISRFRAKARLANLVQSRIKAVNRMDKKDRLEEVKNLEFQFKYKKFTGKFVTEVENISFGYSADNLLINDFSFSIYPDDRICVIGKNGKGKTTLLKLATGILQPTSGSIRDNVNVQKAVYEQTNIKSLVDSNTIVDEIASTDKELDSQSARDICGNMMFEGETALKKISVLSGGEKSRVMLGKIIGTPCNMLALDEPTNHLDMESCDALLGALDCYEGAIIMVTHNEMFLHHLANRLIVFQGGSVSVFEGTYAEFLEKEGWRDEDDEIDKPVKDKDNDKLTKKDARRLRSEIISERSKILKPLEKRIAELEEIIDSNDTRLSEMNDDLVKASEDCNGEKITELSKSIHNLQSQNEALFDELCVISEDFENKNIEFEDRLKDLNV